MKKFTLIIVSLLFFACQSNYNMETVIKNASGKTYYMAAPYKDSQITITISGDKISGYAGVNNYFGTIEIIGNTIKISNIGVIMKNANPKYFENDLTISEYSNDEDGVARFLVKYFNLIIYSDV